MPGKTPQSSSTYCTSVTCTLVLYMSDLYNKRGHSLDCLHPQPEHEPPLLPSVMHSTSVEVCTQLYCTTVTCADEKIRTSAGYCTVLHHTGLWYDTVLYQTALLPVKHVLMVQEGPKDRKEVETPQALAA